MKGSSKYVFGLCMILLLLSCHTQRPVTKINEPALEIKKSAGPEAIFSSRYSFETMKVKRMNIDFMINGIKENFNGNMAVARDSFIAISIIPLLGYEAVRILCTKDSIIVINRTDKTYHASSLDYYMKKYNIPAEFNDLQAVLINEAFIYKADYKDVNYEKSIKIEEGRILFFIESLLGNMKLTNQKITADSTCYKIHDVFVVDHQRNIQMEVRYSDFNGCEIESFPNRISVDIRNKISTVNLDIEYGQVIFDDKINVKFEIQEGYSRFNM